MDTSTINMLLLVAIAARLLVMDSIAAMRWLEIKFNGNGTAPATRKSISDAVAARNETERLSSEKSIKAISHIMDETLIEVERKFIEMRGLHSETQKELQQLSADVRAFMKSKYKEG